MVTGEEDIATKVEAVDQPFDGSSAGIAVPTGPFHVAVKAEVAVKGDAAAVALSAAALVHESECASDQPALMPSAGTGIDP